MIDGSDPGQLGQGDVVSVSLELFVAAAFDAAEGLVVSRSLSLSLCHRKIVSERCHA